MIRCLRRVGRNVILLLLFTSAAPPKPEVLLETPLKLDGRDFRLVVTRTVEKTIATFGESGGKSQAFVLAQPVAPSAEGAMANWGSLFPQSFKLILRGGADGDSYTFTYIFSLVGGKVKQIFATHYRDDYYFRNGECGDFSVDKNGSLFLIEEKPLTLRTTRLTWDKKAGTIQRGQSHRVPIIAKTTGDVALWAKPARQGKAIKNLVNGDVFEIVGFKVCDSKMDGEECASEPFEKYRWFKVTTRDSRVYWVWEKSPFETKLTCNERMDLTE